MLQRQQLNLYQTIRDKIGRTSDYMEGEIITFINPYSYLVARKSTETFSKFDRVYVDGMVLLLLFRISGISNLKRFSFDYTSIGKEVLEYLNASQKSVYIIGTTSNNLEKAIKNIKEMYPSINLLDYRHGYFESDGELETVIKNIVEINPTFVIAGMGSPYQEKFLVKLKEAGWNGTGFTCGGFLHQSAKNVAYYPEWINKLSIRWMYRIWDEPKLVKRYFVWYPISVVMLLKDIVTLNK